MNSSRIREKKGVWNDRELIIFCFHNDYFALIDFVIVRNIASFEKSFKSLKKTVELVLK